MESSTPYGFSEQTFGLLGDLAANNTKDWYKEHKQMITDLCLDPFASVLEAASLRLQANEIEFTGSKKTMFRMHRDVRFSKDKAPYKTNVSGLLTRSGTKDHAGGIVYVHLDTGGGFIAAGRYQLDAKALGPIRDRVIEEPEKLRSALRQLDENGFALDHENTLASMPRGFKEHSDNEFARELKLKSWIARRSLTKASWTSGTVADDIASLGMAAQPLLGFINV